MVASNRFGGGDGVGGRNLNVEQEHARLAAAKRRGQPAFIRHRLSSPTLVLTGSLIAPGQPTVISSRGEVTAFGTLKSQNGGGTSCVDS